MDCHKDPLILRKEAAQQLSHASPFLGRRFDARGNIGAAGDADHFNEMNQLLRHMTPWPNPLNVRLAWHGHSQPLRLLSLRKTDRAAGAAQAQKITGLRLAAKIDGQVKAIP